MSVGTPVPIDVQLACQDSLMRFMAHFDADEFDAMQTLFAPDGTWVRADGTIRGLAELQAWIARRQPGRTFVRHIITNLRFDALDDGRVRVHSYVMAYRHDGQPGDPRPVLTAGPGLMGRYVDDLTLHEGRWKIHHKSVQLDFKLA
jgi:SnoaL-like domain